MTQKMLDMQKALCHTGLREIPLRLIIDLADYYQVCLDYLVGRTRNPELNR